MNRALVLLPMAAIASGCYVSPACDPPTLAVVWSPARSASAGFTLPGLAAGTTLSCGDAGVSSVELSVSGQVIACPGGFGYGCIGTDWPCGIGAVEIDIAGGGTYPVSVSAFDSAGNLKYAVDTSASASACSANAISVQPAGRPGTLSLSYTLDGANCAPNPGNIGTYQGTFMWYTLDDSVGRYDPPVGGPNRSFSCGGTNPIPLAGGAVVPAGVYYLRMEEVAEGSTGAVSYHGLWTSVGGNQCAELPIYHAGPSDVAAVNLTMLPPAIATCFP